jgi:hypothetical protein
VYCGSGERDASKTTWVDLTMDVATVVTRGTDDNDDDPMFWLYLGVQGVQTLFRCWRERTRLPQRKIYFPIKYKRGKSCHKNTTLVA